MKKTIVYIDGFNLYYGAARRWNCKWVDLQSMVTNMLPNNDIVEVRMYTAMLSDQIGDPLAPIRQDVYHRALRSTNTKIILGRFMTYNKKMITVIDLKKRVEVLNTEEKGTDVNLAVDMVHDAHCNRFEAAVLISNDTDFVRAVQVVVKSVGKIVGVINPQRNRQSRQLQDAASFVKTIRKSDLSKNQLRSVIHDKHGTIHKPNSW